LGPAHFYGDSSLIEGPSSLIVGLSTLIEASVGIFFFSAELKKKRIIK